MENPSTGAGVQQPESGSTTSQDTDFTTKEAVPKSAISNMIRQTMSFLRTPRVEFTSSWNLQRFFASCDNTSARDEILAKSIVFIQGNDWSGEAFYYSEYLHRTWPKYAKPFTQAMAQFLEEPKQSMQHTVSFDDDTDVTVSQEYGDKIIRIKINKGSRETIVQIGEMFAFLSTVLETAAQRSKGSLLGQKRLPACYNNYSATPSIDAKTITPKKIDLEQFRYQNIVFNVKMEFKQLPEETCCRVFELGTCPFAQVVVAGFPMERRRESEWGMWLSLSVLKAVASKLDEEEAQAQVPIGRREGIVAESYDDITDTLTWRKALYAAKHQELLPWHLFYKAPILAHVSKRHGGMTQSLATEPQSTYSN